jgi:hypothetical protein
LPLPYPIRTSASQMRRSPSPFAILLHIDIRTSKRSGSASTPSNQPRWLEDAISIIYPLLHPLSLGPFQNLSSPGFPPVIPPFSDLFSTVSPLCLLPFSSPNLSHAHSTNCLTPPSLQALASFQFPLRQGVADTPPVHQCSGHSCLLPASNSGIIIIHPVRVKFYESANQSGTCRHFLSGLHRFSTAPDGLLP